MKRKQHPTKHPAARGGSASSQPKKRRVETAVFAVAGVLLLAALFFAFDGSKWFAASAAEGVPAALSPPRRAPASDPWIERAFLIGKRFHEVYSDGWEGANGAIGDAYLYRLTRDSSLLRFYTEEHDLLKLFNGTWVDDRAWCALAELEWWDVTGRTNAVWVESAKQRYLEARREGRLSNHEGVWSWYNWPPGAKVSDQIFTNSNMNHMASVACLLYTATGERHFLDDALLVWNGDRKTPGVQKALYRGKGVWKGKDGLAAFGKQLPWGGTEYCSIAASLYRVTRDPKYKRIAVATARRIMDPATGWVDSTDFYQLRMDGNGAFVHYLLEAYAIAPDELGDLLPKIGKMLEHVWSNHHGKARMVLHRTSDHGIRNGWNPEGGEDGYGVDQIGTSHAQSQALRAFAEYVYHRAMSAKGGGG